MNANERKSVDQDRVVWSIHSYPLLRGNGVMILLLDFAQDLHLKIWRFVLFLTWFKDPKVVVNINDMKVLIISRRQSSPFAVFLSHAYKEVFFCLFIKCMMIFLMTFKLAKNSPDSTQYIRWTILPSDWATLLGG